MTDEPSSPKRKQPRTLLLVVVGVVVLGAPLGIAAGGYAFARSNRRELQAEAVRSATDLATGVARCSSSSALVPPTSGLVPSVAQTGARTSSRADWSAPAFVCAGFFIEGKQRAQVQWVQTSTKTGTARTTKAFSNVTLAVEVDVVCADDGQPACRVMGERRDGFILD